MISEEEEDDRARPDPSP